MEFHRKSSPGVTGTSSCAIWSMIISGIVRLRFMLFFRRISSSADVTVYQSGGNGGVFSCGRRGEITAGAFRWFPDSSDIFLTSSQIY